MIINVENTKGEIGPLRLRETYHLLSLLVNLFSRTFIRHSNAYICRKTNTIRLHNPNEEIATIDIINENLFVQQLQQLYMPTTTISRVYLSLLELIKLWHQRLGHLGFENVKKIATMTMGMEIKGQEIPEDPCKPCDFGKSKRIVS